MPVRGGSSRCEKLKRFVASGRKGAGPLGIQALGDRVEACDQAIAFRPVAFDGLPISLGTEICDNGYNPDPAIALLNRRTHHPGGALAECTGLILGERRHDGSRGRKILLQHKRAGQRCPVQRIVIHENFRRQNGDALGRIAGLDSRPASYAREAEEGRRRKPLTEGEDFRP